MSTRASRSKVSTARRSRFRRRLRVVTYAILLLTVASVVLTRAVVLRAVSIPLLERMTGAQVTVDDAFMRSGAVVLHGVTLRIPGVEGKAGEVLTVREVTTRPRLASLFPPRLSAKTVLVDGAVLRITQESSDGRLTAAPLLDRPAEESGSLLGSLPSIVITRSAIEYGEHETPGGFTLLDRIQVQGQLAPSGDDPSTYEISLRQLLPTGVSDDALRLAGWVTPASGEGALFMRELQFEDWLHMAVPEKARSWWARAAVRGGLDESSLQFDKHGLEAVLRLAGVDLNLDVPSSAGDDAPLAVRDVRGDVRFSRDGIELVDLRGMIQGLPYTLSGRYDGYDEDGALFLTLRTDVFDIQQTEGLLPFAPEAIHEELAFFDFGHAKLQGEVTLSRPAAIDGQAQPFSIRSDFSVRGFSGVTEHFRYPLTDADGHIQFGDGRLDVHLVGKGASGADVDLRVTVFPRATKSDLDVKVIARDVPADQWLYDALQGIESGRALDDLWDVDSYDRHVADGLIIPAERRAALESERRDLTDAQGAADRERVQWIDEELRKPTFDLGAIADVNVHFHRSEETGRRYRHDVEISVREGQLLCTYFPYPVRVEDGSIILTDETATIDMPNLRGPWDRPMGSIVGQIVLERDGQEVYEPDITITIPSIPIDRFLSHAIPADDAEAALAGEAASSGGRLLNAFHLQGDVSATARITNDGDGSTTFRITCDFRDAAAFPGCGDYPLQNVSGTLVITDHAIELRELTATHGETRLYAAGTIRLGDADELAEAHVEDRLAFRFEDLDLEDPLASLVQPFIESRILEREALPSFQAIWESYRPSGRVDAEILMQSSAGGETRYVVDLSARDPAFDVLGRRVRLRGLIDGIHVDGESVTFDASEAAIMDGDVEAALVHVDGCWRWEGLASPAADQTGSPARRATPDESRELHILARDVRPESDIIRHLLSVPQFGGLGSSLQRFDPAGLIDADISIQHDEQGGVSVRGDLRPRRLAIRRGDQRLSLDQMHGSVTFDRDAITLADLGGNHEHGTFSVTGSLLFTDHLDETEGPTLHLADASLDLQADTNLFNRDLAELIPGELGTVIDRLEIGVDRRLTLSDATLRYVDTGDEALDRFSFEGRFTVEGGCAMIGVPLTDITGTVDVCVSSRPWYEVPTLDVSCVADRIRVHGIEMTDLRLRAVNGSEPGEVLIPTIVADCHSGRVSGMSRLLLGDDQFYECCFAVSNVRLTPVLDELDAGARLVPLDAVEQPSDDDDASPVAEPAPDRGWLHALVGFSGFVDDPDSRRGRVTASLGGGDVVRLPVLLSLIQLSNFVPPAGDQLDYAELDFHLSGREIRFQRIGVWGSTIWISGTGTLDLDDMGIDLEFTTGNMIREVPFLSELFSGVRDEIITMRAIGTLYDPRFESETLRQTKRTLAEIFGTDRPERSRQRPATHRPSAPER
ncbi:MAG: hypothetical protein KAS72_11410 [Phycisphaerales bacterium]|nr:hypothetical protein [Phycisphaerales bacterium]